MLNTATASTPADAQGLFSIGNVASDRPTIIHVDKPIDATRTIFAVLLISQSAVNILLQPSVSLLIWKFLRLVKLLSKDLDQFKAIVQWNDFSGMTFEQYSGPDANQAVEFEFTITLHYLSIFTVVT